MDDPCDLALAVKVTDNAKTQKYSPCNATESLLVARSVAGDFLPPHRRGVRGQGREMRGCPESLRILATVAPASLLKTATEADWSEEYPAPVISVKVVEGWTRPLPTSTSIPATTPMPS